MKFNLVNNKEQALYLWALFFSVALCFSVAVRSFALRCVLVLGCILIIVFIVILFPQASSVLSFPYLQWPLARPLATVSGLPITCATWL